MPRIIHPSGHQIHSIEHAVRDQKWFGAFLDDHGIKVKPASALAMHLGDLDAYIKWHVAGHVFPDSQTWCDVVRGAHGLHHIIRVIKASNARLPTELVARLRVLSGSNIVLKGPGRQSLARDTMWEILVACGFSGFADNVDMAEPDVTGTYRGHQWGLPCKCLYTHTAKRQVDRIVEGAKQLEASSAEFGLVMVNVSAIIDHDHFLRATGDDRILTWPTPQAAFLELRARVRAVIAAWDKTSLVERLRHDRKTGLDRNKTRGVVVFAETCVKTSTTQFDLTLAALYQIRNTIAGEDKFVHAFAHHTGISELLDLSRRR